MNNNTFLHLTKQSNFIFNSSNSQTYRLVCCSPTNELQFKLSQSVAGKISSRVGTSAVLQILTTATLPTSTEQKSPTTHCHWHLSFVTCHLSFVNLSFVICHLQNHCHSCHSCCVLPNLDIKPGSAYHGDWQTPCIAPFHIWQVLPAKLQTKTTIWRKHSTQSWKQKQFFAKP